ncbi:MAG: glycosyl hydrolase family 65 protein [Spirochaetia bacterium]|jgi:cellobiose phosphorylase
MRYGYFDDQRREYVITRPDTPLPWINYLGVNEYCGLISNTAGGYSFYKDARERRILRYRYHNVPSDRPGRYIYIRDNASEEYWSGSWQPVLKELDVYAYECRHGLSYTTISSAYAGIRTVTTYFVPLSENLEIWHIKVTNSSRRKRKLSLFTYVEFCLWDAVNDMTDFQYNLNIGQTRFHNNAIYHVTNFHAHQPCFAWFWSNRKVASYDGARQAFVGPYRSESNPIAVEQGRCSGSLASGWAPFAGLHIDLQLEPGTADEVVFILGYGETMGEEAKHQKKYRGVKNVDRELRKLSSYWDETLARFTVNTPDADVNTMVNVWNQYQCRTTFNWSRSASYYESGIGRGMGFRDSNQDILGFAHQIPDLARARLLDIAATQFPEGRASHQYSPLTKKGSGEGFGDDHLWLIMAAAQYVKESGDIAVLDAIVPYNDGSMGSLFEHLARALEYSHSNTGWHGLPKIENADWNDCLNLRGPNGTASSVMIAEMFVMAAGLMADLSRRSGRQADAHQYLLLGQEMRRKINDSCWDGEWYLRAFDDSGSVVGTSKTEEGRIWLESQTWAVLSGTADAGRGIACMDSVKRLLATKHGIVLFRPAYSRYHPELGYVSVYPKGLKENAAIFCHTNPWAMIAEAMLGRGDQAFSYYKAILPSAGNDIADKRWTEPYVYAQMIAGREHKDFGQGKNSWLTGSASWNFVAISQYILGVRPDLDGLRIDPCIPKTWKGFSVTRVFRGDTYRISVKNPHRVCKGVSRMTVDGRTVEGNLVPVFGDAGTHDVEVVLE